MVLTVSEFTVLSVDQISAPSCGLLARRRLGNGRSLFGATDETIELQLTFVAPYVSSAKLEEDVVSDLDAAIDSGLFLSTLLQNSVAYNLTLFNYAVVNLDFEPSLGSNAYSFSSSYAYFFSSYNYAVGNPDFEPSLGSNAYSFSSSYAYSSSSYNYAVVNPDFEPSLGSNAYSFSSSYAYSSSSYNYDGAAVDAYSSSSYSYDGGNGDDNHRRLSHGANDEYSYEHDVVQVIFSYGSEDSAFSYGVGFGYGDQYSYGNYALDVTFSYGRDDSSFSYGVGFGYGDQYSYGNYGDGSPTSAPTLPFVSSTIYLTIGGMAGCDNCKCTSASSGMILLVPAERRDLTYFSVLVCTVAP